MTKGLMTVAAAVDSKQSSSLVSSSSSNPGSHLWRRQAVEIVLAIVFFRNVRGSLGLHESAWLDHPLHPSPDLRYCTFVDPSMTSLQYVPRIMYGSLGRCLEKAPID
jgi:hypothetical protein